MTQEEKRHNCFGEGEKCEGHLEADYRQLRGSFTWIEGRLFDKVMN